MRLERLAATRFRNLADVDFALDAQFVVFHGPNAQGKTNALEALYWLATLKPLRARRNRELIRWGEQEATVAGRVVHEGIARRYRVDVDGRGRRVQVDGSAPSELADYFSGIRAIAFTPTDGDIVLGGPAGRRQWIDRAAFTQQPAHLGVVRAYQRVLDQKAALLRSGHVDPTLLEALEDRQAAEGARLVTRRVALLRELEPHVQRLFAGIAGHDRPVTLRYRGAGGQTVDPVACRAALAERIVAARDGERQRKMVLVGPQRDDVVLSIDGAEARTFGSRGQVRSLVLSLKLAELEAARAHGQVPLFLLDDLSSELDRQRTSRLVDSLEALGAQVFITTTDPDQIVALPVERTLRVEVREGVLSPGSGPG